MRKEEERRQKKMLDTLSEQLSRISQMVGDESKSQRQRDEDLARLQRNIDLLSLLDVQLRDIELAMELDDVRHVRFDWEL